VSLLRGQDGLRRDGGRDRALALIGEEYQQVLAAIRALPDRQREALVLCFYLDLSEEETARAMAVSRGTVKSATSRAVAALGRKLTTPLPASRWARSPRRPASTSRASVARRPMTGRSLAGGPESSAATGGPCSARNGRTLVGFLLEAENGQGPIPENLVDFETECATHVNYPDGAYIGWANADGSSVIAR
jgi:hypothetical protein